MKAKLTTEDFGKVAISYDVKHYEGVSRIERVFNCPSSGGYVIEYRNGDWKQVCDRLEHTGSTLFCSSRDKLKSIIRREYQAMRRAEKREANRYL